MKKHDTKYWASIILVILFLGLQIGSVAYYDSRSIEDIFKQAEKMDSRLEQAGMPAEQRNAISGAVTAIGSDIYSDFGMIIYVLLITNFPLIFFTAKMVFLENKAKGNTE